MVERTKFKAEDGGERKMKKTGTLIYDHESERMDIRFGLEEYYGGLHCGTGMEVLVEGEWIPTCIEKYLDWYLAGIDTKDLVGLTVRI